MMDMQMSSAMSNMPAPSSPPMSMMSMDSMATMTFHTSIHDPLYSAAWTPHSASAYAGTCIFLIVLGALWRGSLALKAIMERRWLDAALRRRYVVVAGKPREAERVSQESDGKPVVLLTERGVEEEVRVVRSKARPVMPWRWSVDLPRALLVVLVSGLGYLLMLAIMTFNVGYFLSVLGGIFLGELMAGRYTQMEEH
ncbi:hypothetical protein GP486_008574 [Trichoglossum hirsutum]|uniref:Copper transport protein n=1 Tax=Trichoglossum hirsutum TaxID=265104 RepID=A0A9P8IDB0_9PEZI|nr:hypothetical protein GP486_008574 [Trichoglossum hirsutum]